MLSSRDHNHLHHPHSVSMDYHPSDRRKRDHTKHDTFYTEPRRLSHDDDTSNTLNNKRRRKSYIDCDDFCDTEAAEMVDVLTSRRMRILLPEKPWHDYIDPSVNFTKTNATALSMKEQKELQEFQDKQRNMQLEMADEALNQWKEWCSSHSDPFDMSLSLKKLIDFIGNKVIPQENAILRQMAHDNRIPISGVESLLLPLLRRMHQEEEKAQIKIMPQRSPLMVSIRTGPHPSPVLPSFKSLDPPVFSRPSHSEYVTIVDQTTKVDSETEEEEEEVSPWTSVKPTRDRTPSPSAVLDDVSCLENSLEIVSTISAEVESLCKAAHISSINFSESNPYLLTESFFARLRKDQAKAERLGLNGTLYNSLLVEVLEEHVQLVQTLSAQMSNRVMSLVPSSLIKNYAVSKVSLVSSSLVPDPPLQTPRSIGMSSPIASKKTVSKEPFKTAHQDMAQPDDPYARIDQDQGTKVNDQVRMGYQDVEMQAAEPLIAISNRSEADSHDKNQIGKSETGEGSVWLAWQRWKVGEDGSLPLEELVKREGSEMMVLELRNYCAIAYDLSGEIEKLCAGGMKLDIAIQSLEARRYLTLPTLAMVICQEKDRWRTSEGLTFGEDRVRQQPSSLFEELTGVISSRSALDSTIETPLGQSAPFRNSEVIPTLAPSLASLVPVGKPVSELPIASYVEHTPINVGSGATDFHFDHVQQTSGTDSVVSRVVAAPTACSLGATSSSTFGPSHGLSGTSSSTESSAGSLRSTFKALAAMNTTVSTLGPAFNQWRTTTQPMTDKPRSESLQTVPGSLPLYFPSSSASNTQSFPFNLSIAGPVLTPTPSTMQGLATSPSYRPTPQSSRLPSDQAVSFGSTLFGFHGSFSHAPSASAASTPSSRPSVPTTQANIQNYLTAPFRPQQASIRPPSQSQMLVSPQQQAASLPKSQAPTPFVYRSSVQTQSDSTAPSSTGATIAQPAPSALESFDLAGGQGVMPRLNTVGLTEASLTSSDAMKPFRGVTHSASMALAVPHAPIPCPENNVIEFMNVGPLTVPTIPTTPVQSVHIASSIAASTPPFTTKQQATPPAAPITSAPTTTTTTATRAPATTGTTATAPLQTLTITSSQTPATELIPPAPISAAGPQAHETAAPQVPRISDTTALSMPTSFTALIIKSTAPNQPLSASSTAADEKEQIQIFRINFELQTVFEIWDLWTLGIQGSPSVTDLIGKHKMAWLHPTDRETYRDYRSVLLTLERSVRLLKLDVRVGLAKLESVRVEFNMSVRQFAKILTEVDAGKATPSTPSTLGSPPSSSSLLLSMTLPTNHTPETIQAFTKAITAMTLPQPSSITTVPRS